MSPDRPRLLAIAVLLSIIPVAGAAEVYKWIDEDGVTHYSQQPPPEGAETVITPDSEPQSAAEGSPDAAGEDGNGNADDADGDGDQETIADFCNELRDREDILESDRPIRIKAEDGTLTELDDEGRAQRLERIQGQLQDHCQDVNMETGSGA